MTLFICCSWTIDTPVDELVMRMQCSDDIAICVQHVRSSCSDKQMIFTAHVFVQLVERCCRLVESPNRCVACKIIRSVFLTLR